MPRQRFFNLPADARDKLLKLALEEFAERGFEDASLNEILAKAGVSKGAYYYYFDDKEDLFATALEGVTDSALGRLPLTALETADRDEFWPAVESLLRHWLETFDSVKTLFRVLRYVNETRRRSPRFAPVLEKARAFWRTFIEAGQRVGWVRTDLSTDMLVRLVEANDAVLDSAFIEMHPKVTRAAFEKHMNLVLDTMKRLLVVDGPEPRRRSPRKGGARRRG
jgi:AcrR family transcriptional regulator